MANDSLQENSPKGVTHPFRAIIHDIKNFLWLVK